MPSMLECELELVLVLMAARVDVWWSECGDGSRLAGRLKCRRQKSSGETVAGIGG
jgi:hypothetical protein